MTWLRSTRLSLIAAVTAVIGAAFGFELLIRATPLPTMSKLQAKSEVVLSSSGEVLWGFLSEDEHWRLSASVHSIDPLYIRALIAYEDRRFWSHRGVDPVAIVRVIAESMRFGRMKSGGSTITMQVVRLLEPRPRTLSSKIDQIFKALRLERHLTKQEILDSYLTLAPFGGNIEGVRAASLIYFAKEPKQLSLREAALLVALPQSPETRRPDRHPDGARVARDRVIGRLAGAGVVELGAARRAMASEAIPAARPLTQHAPHLATRLRQQLHSARVENLETLIDHRLQRQLEGAASRAVMRWGDGVSVAAIVLRNRDLSVAAYLGGADLISNKRNGHVDLVQATRSPGSTLKPLIYAMAFEKLIVHPETIIADEPIDLRGYRPENADGKFLGDISVRQALIRSRNTTAVALLEKIGVDAFLTHLHNAGRPVRLPSGARPGLAVALGGAGASLEQLTVLYSAFANGGNIRNVRYARSDPIQPQNRIFPTAVASTIADILADVPPPPGFARQQSLDGGRRIGFKTGTSFGFRDAWAIGFDEGYTVGVWIGRPDGAPHLGAYGATAAAPIMLEVFDALPVPRRDVASADLGILASYRVLPERLKRFSLQVGAEATTPLEITFPRNGSSIVSNQMADFAIELPLTLSGGRPPYKWILPGVEPVLHHVPVVKWAVKSRGQFDISVTDSDGSVAKSSFWLE